MTASSAGALCLSPLRNLARPLARAGQRFDFGLLLIFALPWALLSAGANWIFGYVGQRDLIDPWVYFGFFLDLRTHLKLFPQTYYGSRLSWILPGYAIYKLLSPITAAYVLHVGLYYGAAFSLYLTLRRTVGRRAALLGSCLMGSYGYFLWAMRWDYVDGAGIVYFLLTILTLTYAAETKHSSVFLVLSGAFCGAMIYSQLFLLIFTAPLAFYYLALNRSHGLRRGLLAFTSGLVLITVFLGIISKHLDGSFLFYAPSIRFATQLVSKPDPWKFPIQSWWARATWLIVAGLASVSSVAFLLLYWKRRFDRQIRFLLTFQILFLLCALLFVISEVLGIPVFESWFYASFLIPGAFLALGAQLGLVTASLTSRQFSILLFGTVAVLELQYRFPPGISFTTWVASHAWWIFLACVLTGVLLALLRRKTFAIVSLCFVSFVAVGLINIVNDHFRAPGPASQKEGFLAIVQSVKAVRAVTPNSKILFWYRLDEPMGGFYRTVASTYLWGYSIVNERFPSLEHGDDSYQAPGPNMRMVILSKEPDAFNQAALSLKKIGLVAQLLAEERIQEGGIGWRMFFITLRNEPGVRPADPH